MALLTNKEKELLKTLDKKGPLTAIEIPVEQLQMPDKIVPLITKLEKKGLISKKHLRIGLESETIPKRAKQVALAKFIWNLGGRDYIKNLIRDQNGE